MTQSAGRVTDAYRYPLAVAAMALQVHPRAIEAEYAIAEQPEADQ